LKSQDAMTNLPSVNTPPSKTRIALMWLLLTVVILVAVTVGLWCARGRAPAEAPSPSLLRAVIMLIFGGMLLVAGVAAYLVVVFSTCFTFNFSRPMWTDLKGKLFVANIFVPMLLAIGAGVAASGILSPILTGLGLDGTMAIGLPVMAAIVGLQFLQLWVLVWGPVEKRFITRRLLAQGIRPEQIASGILAGISNPASGFAKRFALIEEDMGVLWVSPDRLVFWGDVEQFSLTREEVVQIERKADKGSTTMLWGLQHTILHVRGATGVERQIRLHVEGLWTMGQKRRAMAHLAELVANWKSSEAPVAATSPR